VDAVRPAQPITREIPVVKPTGATATQHLPPHPGATPPAPVGPSSGPVEAAQPTGPVDFVPGLPGAGTPPPPPVPPAQIPAAPVPEAPVSEAPDAPSTSWPDSLLEDAPDGRHEKRAARSPRNRAVSAGLVLAVLAVVLLELGLALDFGSESFWSVVPLWSAFATVAALVGLLACVAFYPAGNRLRPGQAWRIGVGGLAALAAFWLLVVLPVVDTDRGFLLTAALACLGVALWIAPRQKV
jgi:hypothetical protein